MMRFYRALLRLYPKGFRAEYRDELCHAFAERTRNLSAPAAFVAAITDVVPNAIGAHRDNLRHGTSGGMSLPTVAGDIRLALRQIRSTPLFSGVLIVVIALGIGINTGLLTTLNQYAWQPAPGIVSDGRLARLTPTVVSVRTDRPIDAWLSYPDILDLRERREVFSEVVAWDRTSLATDFGAGAESVDVYHVTANYLRMLGVTLAAGTGFPDGTDQAAAPLVVIGHSLWMTHFGGSPEAIGKTIRIMNLTFTVVGVAPPRFVGVDVLRLGSPSIWVPLGARALLAPETRDDLRRRETVFLDAVVRMAPGVSASDIGPLTAVFATRLAQEDPESHRRFAFQAERLAGMRQERSDTQELVIAFFIIAALVVVITCTNVSALLLGRAVARRREIGVRLAIGATRMRIIRQMLTEALVLGLAGALVGLLLYTITIKIAYATIPEVIYGLDPSPDTFFFAAVFALVATITFGLAPAVHASKADIGEVIKNSGTLQIRRGRLQAGFVVIQLACSIPALVVTSLVLTDMRRGMNDNAAPASVVTMASRMASGLESRDSVAAAAAPATYARVKQRLEAIPGVQSVGIDAMEAFFYGREVSLSFEDPAGVSAGPRVRQFFVTPGYFAARDIPLVRGREMGRGEDHAGSVAVVVDEEVASRLWPGADPIGRQLVRRSDPSGASTTFEVIGVAGKALYDDDAERQPRVYVPLATASALYGVNIAVRTAGEARPFVPPIRAAIREVEPLATVGSVSTLAEQYAGRRREALLSNLAAFAVGAAALLLASLGLYAIIAFAVAQRTREIGVRLAMGATSGDVVRHFFKGGLKVTAVGLAIGLPATVAGIILVKASLIGFNVQKVAAVMLVVPVLIVIAGLASWLPARRAGRVDPLDALRSE